MYEPVLVDKELDLYNVSEVHDTYRILAMAVNVSLQVAEEICHILNEFQIKTLQPCPKCGHPVIIRENVMGGVCYIVCRNCGLLTTDFKYKQNLIGYWNATTHEDALNYLQKDCVAVIKEQE